MDTPLPEWERLIHNGLAAVREGDARLTSAYVPELCKALEDALLARSEQSAKIERLEAALRPFADLTRPSFDDEEPPKTGHVHLLIYGEGELGDLKMEDFWLARQALAGPNV